jgi:hypothetical protein
MPHVVDRKSLPGESESLVLIETIYSSPEAVSRNLKAFSEWQKITRSVDVKQTEPDV